MTALLELNELRFAYAGGDWILDGASLELSSGDRLMLSGAIGSGKSTLLSLIVGLQRPASGQVTAFGQLCGTEADFERLRQKVGLVFQEPDDMLFSPTVADDVAFGPLNLGMTAAQIQAVVADTLEALQISHLRDRSCLQLSGGEKRLVSLAAVLAMRPEILLLDEPSNGLDEREISNLAKLLAELAQPMIIVSHDARLRELATRAARLADGKIQSDGSAG